VKLSKLRVLPLLLAPILAGCPGASEDPRPNILLITIDTLRADHIGLYGYARPTTPRLDAFFGEASIFENAMSTSPCTRPSVRQYLSGSFFAKPGGRHLAEHLLAAGYQTAAVVSQHQFYERLNEDYTPGFLSFDIQRQDEVDRFGLSTRSAVDISDRALRWLGGRDPAQPYFLWLHYFDPHDPYEPPAAFRSFDRGNTSTLSGDRRGYQTAASKSSDQPWFSKGEIFSEADVAHFVNLYDGEIRYVDEQIGRIFDWLDEQGHVDDTIVVLTADHGEMLGEGGYWDHCFSLGEPEIRAPLLLRVEGGRLGDLGRTQLAASTIDLLPTILGRLQIGFEASDYQGADLAIADPNRTVIAVWKQSSAIRSRSFKLHHDRKEPTALYRIAADPGEQRSLLTQEAGAASSLLQALRAHKLLLSKVGRETEEAARRLKALGYIQ